jgi:hypothetical protein
VVLVASDLSRAMFISKCGASAKSPTRLRARSNTFYYANNVCTSAEHPNLAFNGFVMVSRRLESDLPTCMMLQVLEVECA